MTGQLLTKAARPLGKQVLRHPAAVPQSNTVVKSLLQGTSSSARNRQTLSKARWRRRPAASLTGQQRRRPPTIHWLLPVPLLCRAITSVQALPSSARYDAMRARCQLSTLCTPRRAGAGWRKASSRDATTGKGHAGSQAHPRLLKHWLMQQPSLLCTGQATRRTPWHAQRQRWQGPHLGAKQGVEGLVEHAVSGLQAAGRAGRDSKVWGNAARQSQCWQAALSGGTAELATASALSWAEATPADGQGVASPRSRKAAQEARRLRELTGYAPPPLPLPTCSTTRPVDSR